MKIIIQTKIKKPNPKELNLKNIAQMKENTPFIEKRDKLFTE